MQKIELHYLRQYESDFVQFLLNGIADDKLDIGPKCVKFLDEHGVRMKEALTTLGELEDEKMEEVEEVVKIEKKAVEPRSLVPQKPKYQPTESNMDDID
jgi:hypothetical protein